MLLNYNIIIYYIYVFLVYKQEIFNKYIFYESKCGASERCLEKLSSCRNKYKRETEYTRCISLNLFGKSKLVSELPDEIKNPYLEKFYNAAMKQEYRENIKNVYFEFILDLLELAYNNESYTYLFDNVTDSLILDLSKIKSDIENGKIDTSEMKNAKFSNLKEKTFYTYIAYKKDEELSKAMGLFDPIVNFDGNYNEEMFYSVINEKYFQNDLTNDQIQHIIENHDDRNLQGLLLLGEENGNLRKREEFLGNIISGMSELNKILVDYDSSNYKDIIDNIYKDDKSDHNIFEMIDNISTYFFNTIDIKYNYIKDNNEYIHLTSKLDANSIYENSTTVAESIYNWIYDYYDSIYTTFVNDTDTKNIYDIYYYNNNTILYDTQQVKGSKYLLDNSDFYYSIYSPIISLENKNKNNSYVKESVKLVNELYIYYSLGDYELKNIEKKKLNDTIDINYEEYINETFDTIFKENTFKYLIDSDESDVDYIEDLKNHITQSCVLYNKEKVNPMTALSVIQLENYYNIVYGKDDNLLHESWACNGGYEGVISKIELQKYIKYDFDDDDNENLERSMGEFVKNIVITELIKIDKLNKIENSNNLKKRDTHNVEFNNKILSKRTTSLENLIYNIVNSIVNSEDRKAKYKELYKAYNLNEPLKNIVEHINEFQEPIIRAIEEFNGPTAKVADISLDFINIMINNNYIKAIPKKDGKKMSPFNMSISRIPDIKLVETLQAINDLYYPNKISRNNLMSYDAVKLGNDVLGNDVFFDLNMKFNAPEKAIIKYNKNGVYGKIEEDNRININQMNDYSEALLDLYVKKLAKKYSDVDPSLIEGLAKIEIDNFADKYNIAIRNPMVYGKCINQLFDNSKITEFLNLSEGKQNEIINRLMAPVDPKIVLKQALLKLYEDSIITTGNSIGNSNEFTPRIAIIGEIELEDNTIKKVGFQNSDIESKKSIDKISKNASEILDAYYDYRLSADKKHQDRTLINSEADVEGKKISEVNNLNKNFKENVDAINEKFNAFNENNMINCKIKRYIKDGKKITGSCKNNKNAQNQKMNVIKSKNEKILNSVIKNLDNSTPNSNKTPTKSHTTKTKRPTSPTHPK